MHLNFSDFDAALDLFAEMIALDCDIDFTIEKGVEPSTNLAAAQSYDDPVLQVEEMNDEEYGDISTMKRWKTRRKKYNDHIERKIVVHARTFRSKQAKAFTSDLGLGGNDDSSSSSENESDSPAPMEIWESQLSHSNRMEQRDFSSFMKDPQTEESETKSLLKKGGK